MGKGIDAIRDQDPHLAALMDDLKDQLLIAFLKRLGGKITMPVVEIDDTGGSLFMLRFDPAARAFHFELKRKQ